MTEPPAWLIAVTAVDHRERDAWVDEHAAIAAAEGGLILGEYLRLEVLPEIGICRHLFAATRSDNGGTE